MQISAANMNAAAILSEAMKSRLRGHDAFGQGPEGRFWKKLKSQFQTETLPEIAMRRYIVCGKSPAEAREIVVQALDHLRRHPIPCPTFDEL